MFNVENLCLRTAVLTEFADAQKRTLNGRCDDVHSASDLVTNDLLSDNLSNASKEHYKQISKQISKTEGNKKIIKRHI